MQLVLLSAASQRDDHCLTLPTGVQRGSARKAAAKLLEAGLVKEVRARKDAPIWRRDEETEQPFALKLTAAGLMAIATEANEDSVEAAPTVDDAVSSQRPESFLAARLRSRSSIHRRWLRLLWADVKKRILTTSLLALPPAGVSRSRRSHGWGRGRGERRDVSTGFCHKVLSFAPPVQGRAADPLLPVISPYARCSGATRGGFSCSGAIIWAGPLPLTCRAGC